MRSDSAFGYAAAAIALWGALATLSVQLAHVPPFMLVGLALCIGGLCGARHWREWRVPRATFLLGCVGLFGYHFCLFMALRYAPALEANLINYLWPLLIVVLAPVLLPGMTLSGRHLVGALLGLAGCVVIVTGEGTVALDVGHALGYALALIAAVLWASYSLLTRRVKPFHTGAIGGFCMASGLLALGAHALLEPTYRLAGAEWAWLVALGAGPMGAAFFFWDAALKRGDARSIGTMAYLTPLLSTTLLALFGGGQLGGRAAAACVLILGGALVGNGMLPPRLRSKSVVQ